MFHIILLFGCQLFPRLWNHFQNFMMKKGRLFRKLTDLHLDPCWIWNLSIFFPVFCSFFFLQLHGHLPAVLCNNMSFVSDQSTYHLCASNNLQILHTPSVTSDFNPLTACNRIWNTHPEFAWSYLSFGMIKNYVRELLASTKKTFWFPLDLMSLDWVNWYLKFKWVGIKSCATLV